MTRMMPGLLVACLSAAVSGAAAAPSGSLLVLSKGDLTLSVVDPVTSKVLAVMPSGPDPHEVAATPDGRTAFVSNYGGGSLDTISVLDLAEHRPLPPIRLGALRGPHGLIFVDGKLWFTAEGAKVIGRYDPTTRQIDLVLGTGQDRTHMIFVSEDGGRIVTSNVASATLTFIDRAAAGGPPGPPRDRWTETVVPVGRGAEGFDVSPRGSEIWAANAQDGTISIVDAATRAVTATLAANVSGANRLKFTPDGRRVIVSSLGRAGIVILDAATRKELKRLDVCRGAAGIQMEPGGARAYVACTPDDHVVVIDLATLEVTGRIDAGRQPDGLAWAARR